MKPNQHQVLSILFLLPRPQASTAAPLVQFTTSMSSESAPTVVVHSGGCHCRRVRWQADAPASLAAGTCNCSNCAMRGITYFTVPNDRFRLQDGAEEFLTTYTFGTGTAKHIFCKVCGITSFYKQRGNPGEVALSVNCIDAGTVEHVEVTEFDGKNWGY